MNRADCIKGRSGPAGPDFAGLQPLVHLLLCVMINPQVLLGFMKMKGVKYTRSIVLQKDDEKSHGDS